MNQGPDLIARTCPNCGARIQTPPAGGRTVCHYCGQTFDAPMMAPPPPPRIVVVAPTTSHTYSPMFSPMRRIMGGVVSVVIVAAVGLVQALVHRDHGGSTAMPSLPSLPHLTGSTSSFMWDTVAGPPAPAAIGGSNVEGFVGRIRARGGDDTLWIAGFEGSKLEEVWKAGPYGTYSEGYQSTFSAVLGSKVVATDYRANVHVFDAATGKETKSVKLTDRAKSMCASPDGKAKVWIEVSDEKNVIFDADAGTTTPAARPAWCPDLWAASHDCRGWLKRGPIRPGCKGPENAPKMNGFEAENVLEDGDLGVALGKKHPGTAVPMAVGYDPKTKAVRWSTALPSGDQAGAAELGTTQIMDALAGGRFASPYELTSNGWRFTAFDARSGARLWDIKLQPLIGVDTPEGFSLSPTRVYVMRTSTLEVYDAKSGGLVGVLGD